MKHSEKQIASIAIKVIKDIDWLFDQSKGVTPVEHTLEEQVLRLQDYKDHPNYQTAIASMFPYWCVMMDFPKDDGWEGRNKIWVNINDDTGLAYEVAHRQYEAKLRLNEKGIYEKIAERYK
jgi:hypothetical protein